MSRPPEELSIMLRNWNRVMVEFLDRYSRPVEYMLVGVVGDLLGALLSLLLGVADDTTAFV